MTRRIATYRAHNIGVNRLSTIISATIMFHQPISGRTCDARTASSLVGHKLPFRHLWALICRRQAATTVTRGDGRHRSLI